MRSFALVSARKLSLATVAAALLAFAPIASSAQADPPAQAGRLSFVSGTVSIQPVGADDWSQAMPNLPLGPGDRIFTDADGRAEIQVGQTYLRLGPNTDISIVAESEVNISFGVAQGAVHLHCHGLWPGQAARIHTPSGSAALFQPGGELRVDVTPQQQVAIFTDLAGDARITGAGGYLQPLSGGQALELAGSNPVAPQWLEPAGFDDLDNWSQHRDHQIYRPSAYRYVSPEIAGADELDANGTWQPGTEYGAIWFPRNVAPDWAPYRNGRWINHAPWGWVWVEDEPWGYAPFHYGRWVNYSGRWGWVPGPPASHPVWSPALVVFAGGIHAGGVGVSAWFPLGPGEPYKPWYHASPRYIDQVNITNISESPRVHVQTSYVNVVNVTNVTYVNRTVGVTAMRQEDFASGRPARSAAVTVDAHQMDHVQALAQPDVKPNPHALAGQPPAHPVPVSSARPAVIDEKGKLVSSKPGAQPVDPPVKAAPQIKSLPGHTAAAPPASASKTAAHATTAKPAGKNAAPTAAAQPATPAATKPGKTTQQPAALPASAAPPAKTAATPATKPASQPAPKTAAAPAAKPAATPSATPAAKPQPDKKGDKKNDKKDDK
jgi:hypothetical protein